MKKLMFAASAAICATVGFAVDGVQSNNIVGYNMTKLEPGKYFIGAAQFEDVESGTVDLNKVVSGLTSEPFDDEDVFLKTAPQIQIINAKGTYDIYYYLSDAYVVEGDNAGARVEGWSNDVGEYADVKLTSGTAFWLKTNGASDQNIVSGAVCGEDSVDVKIPQSSFKLVANAFPMVLELNGPNVSCDGIAEIEFDDEDLFLTTAPQVQVQKENGGYDVYYYLCNGWDESESKRVPGWCDDVGCIVKPEVSVGRGFWAKGVSSDFTFSFSK